MMVSGGGWFVPILLLVLIGVSVVFAINGGAGGRDRDRVDQAPVRRWLPVLLGILASLLLISVLVFGTGRPGDGWWGPMGGPMGGMWGQRSGQGEAPDAVPDAEELTVEVTEMAFEPVTLEVTAGEPVNLTVTNVGDAFHDLTIDELDLQLGVEPGETLTAGLEVAEPGEYRYYCSVPGHASAGMEGTLTVRDTLAYE